MVRILKCTAGALHAEGTQQMTAIIFTIGHFKNISTCIQLFIIMDQVPIVLTTVSRNMKEQDGPVTTVSLLLWAYTMQSFFLTEVYLIDNIMLVSSVQHRDSVIYIYIYI